MNPPIGSKLSCDILVIEQLLSENVVAFSNLGMAQNFEFAIVMYHPDNGQRSYKTQTKHTERMILPSSSQKILVKWDGTEAG